MNVQENISLKNYNTFGIDVNARFYCEIFSLDDPNEIRELLIHYPEHFFLGGGSNVLFQNDYKGLVLRVALQGIELIDENDDYVLLKAMAGEDWDGLVEYCVGKGYGGLENLSLIPGTVGAAPIQNIGAYGVELKDCFHSLTAIELNSAREFTFSNDECDFDYRNSVFKNRLKGQFLITSVTFKLSIHPALKLSYGMLDEEVRNLTQGEEATINHAREAVISIRKSKLPDPVEYGNAGSFFKNPIVDKETFHLLHKEFPDLVYYEQHDSLYKIPAGWMIERCGLKGYRKGDAGVYEKQALVLVNYGKATGSELIEMADYVRKEVENKFGLTLEREVTVI